MSRTTTNMRLDSSAGLPGTPINAENALGLDSSDFEAKFQAMVRVGERHRLRFDYFTLDRTGQTTLTTPRSYFATWCCKTGDPVGFHLEPAHARHHLRILVHPSREIRARRDRRHQRHGHLGPRTRRHANAARGSNRGSGGPVPHVRSRLHVRDEQAILSRCPRAVLQSAPSITSTARWDSTNSMRCTGLRPNISFALGYTAARADIESRQAQDTQGISISDSKGPEVFVRIAF